MAFGSFPAMNLQQLNLFAKCFLSHISMSYTPSAVLCTRIPNTPKFVLLYNDTFSSCFEVGEGVTR